MGWLEEFLEKLRKNIAETVRKFTAYSYVLFFLGGLYGAFSPRISEFAGFPTQIVIAAPLVLALLAYLSTEIAAILFMGLVVLMLILFL